MTAEERVAAKSELLAVDDNELVLRVIEDHFAPRGFVVRLARSVAEALEALRGGLPDVVVSDVLMPEVDGWAFYEKFRALPGSEEVPFLFLTVESDVPKRVRGLRLGADDYLAKPFDPRELHARIDRLLERRAAAAAARRGEDALLAGSVEHLSISDLLQILSLNGNDGTVVLAEEGREGTIDLEGGTIVHAAAGRVRGKKALFRMLGWASAKFHVVKRSGTPLERSIEGPSTTVLMDGLVALDEWTRVARDLPPRHAVVRIADDARSRLHAASVGPAEYEVLTRARREPTVEALLDDLPFPDVEVGTAIVGLVGRGILVVEA
jgi:DNA-binding response OmpR family regulator